MGNYDYTYYFLHNILPFFEDIFTLDMSSNKVQCPVCGKYFTTNGITMHVEKCLNDSEEIKPNDSTANAVDSPPAKRPKTSDSPDSSHKGEDEAGKKSAWGSLSNPFSKVRTPAPIIKSKTSDSSVKNVTFGVNSSPKQKQEKEITDVLDSAKPSAMRSDKSLASGSASMPPVKASVRQAPLSAVEASPDRKISLSERVPLAEQLRPRQLEEYVGQTHAVGRETLLRSLLSTNQIPSLILWGPPGCGKTTLARIVAEKCKHQSNMRFVQLSATTAGIAEVKDAIKVAKNEIRLCRRKTVLFIDEIHRFNKLQQDAFLPHVEDGTVTLIGATTENPSFQVNHALLSRCKVIVLEKLSEENVAAILRRATTALGIREVESDDEEESGDDVRERTEQSGGSGDGGKPALPAAISRGAMRRLVMMADGDARTALNNLQTALTAAATQNSHVLRSASVASGLGGYRGYVPYDRNGEEHYNCASALQKSIRGSSLDGSMYWLARMLEGGEDPLFIARRLVVVASEDVGLADAGALPLSMATHQACHVIGLPECAINLAHCVSYLARAPKSNASYAALNEARKCVRSQAGAGVLPGVPMHLRNAPTTLMRELGYGAGYKYSHDHRGGEGGGQRYLPDSMQATTFFKQDEKAP